MSPPLSQGVNLKHCREKYMAVRRVEQNAKHQTPPVTNNNTTGHLRAFTDETNRSGTSIVTCLQNETGRCGGVEAIIHI